jgi:hypothetical protein
MNNEPLTLPTFEEIFAKQRNCLSNEELGVTAMSGKVWSEYELGKLLRIGLDALDSNLSGELSEMTKTFVITEGFYEEFSKFARRRLSRLASKNGVTSESLRLAIKADDNFEIVKGSESANEYVRLSNKLR